ncbi:MAG TPA: type II CAAX endopeptidase family protein [Blastocatellia bacterium]|nr:type II CAAX endopeptidase family protein [Blastocatellia bacterium]HNG28869.1 type II CAAX endopeptidase family protein [Blastocatellia bacterium]
MLGLDAAFRLALWLMHKPIPQVEITRGLAILSLILTFVMQLAAMAGSWMYVTRFGKKPFLRTLGWRWHTQFRWVHAVALAALMYGVAILLSKLLPHRETELEKVLKLGLLVRVMVVMLAVLAAPIVEEVVYRGVVYSAAEQLGGKAFGVGLVTFVFALVHVPQYWGSVVAITTIVVLSFTLTLLRAWTDSLLPCVAMHFVYNGVQGVFLLFAPDKALESAPKETASTVITVISRWCGLN